MRELLICHAIIIDKVSVVVCDARCDNTSLAVGAIVNAVLVVANVVGVVGVEKQLIFLVKHFVSRYLNFLFKCTTTYIKLST